MLDLVLHFCSFTSQVSLLLSAPILEPWLPLFLRHNPASPGLRVGSSAPFEATRCGGNNVEFRGRVWGCKD